MVSIARLRGLSPELRAAIFHFTVFGSTGISSVYFGVWLANRGISPDEIGWINAAPVLLLLVINLFVGRLADRADDWRQVIIVLALIAGAVPIALFFVSGFWLILLTWTLCIVPAYTLTPVIDAATLRMTQRNGTDFAFIRAWGTIGYTISTALAGPVLAHFGEAAFLPLFLIWSLVRAGLSLQLPRFRAPGQAGLQAPPPATARQLRQVLKPWFVLPLIGIGMHQSIHGVLSAFGALLWVQQGISESLIGPLIAVMAMAEATMLFVWKRLGARFPARHAMIFAALVGAVRWGAMALSPPVWLLFLLQTLHAVTLAVGYLAGLQFIANWTSEDIAAEAQGFAFVLQQTMGVIALVAFGWCVALFGAKAWFVASAFALTGAALVYISLRLQAAHR